MPGIYVYSNNKIDYEKQLRIPSSYWINHENNIFKFVLRYNETFRDENIFAYNTELWKVIRKICKDRLRTKDLYRTKNLQIYSSHARCSEKEYSAGALKFLVNEPIVRYCGAFLLKIQIINKENSKYLVPLEREITPEYIDLSGNGSNYGRCEIIEKNTKMRNIIKESIKTTDSNHRKTETIGNLENNITNESVEGDNRWNSNQSDLREFPKLNANFLSDSNKIDKSAVESECKNLKSVNNQSLSGQYKIETQADIENEYKLPKFSWLREEEVFNQVQPHNNDLSLEILNLKYSDISDSLLKGIMFTIRHEKDSLIILQQKTKVGIDEVLENSKKVHTKQGDPGLLNSSLLSLENMISRFERSEFCESMEKDILINKIEKMKKSKDGFCDSILINKIEKMYGKDEHPNNILMDKMKMESNKNEYLELILINKMEKMKGNENDFLDSILIDKKKTKNNKDECHHELLMGEIERTKNNQVKCSYSVEDSYLRDTLSNDKSRDKSFNNDTALNVKEGYSDIPFIDLELEEKNSCQILEKEEIEDDFILVLDDEVDHVKNDYNFSSDHNIPNKYGSNDSEDGNLLCIEKRTSVNSCAGNSKNHNHNNGLRVKSIEKIQINESNYPRIYEILQLKNTLNLKQHNKKVEEKEDNNISNALNHLDIQNEKLNSDSESQEQLLKQNFFNPSNSDDNIEFQSKNLEQLRYECLDTNFVVNSNQDNQQKEKDNVSNTPDHLDIKNEKLNSDLVLHEQLSKQSVSNHSDSDVSIKYQSKHSEQLKQESLDTNFEAEPPLIRRVTRSLQKEINLLSPKPLRRSARFTNNLLEKSIPLKRCIERNDNIEECGNSPSKKKKIKLNQSEMNYFDETFHLPKRSARTHIPYSKANFYNQSFVCVRNGLLLTRKFFLDLKYGVRVSLERLNVSNLLTTKGFSSQ